MSKFAKRVRLFKRLIKRGSITVSPEWSEETQAKILAMATLNLSDDALSLMVLESYFLYKPEIRKRDICHNANSKNCAKCHEPECDLAKGWWKPPCFGTKKVLTYGGCLDCTYQIKCRDKYDRAKQK